jgi:hypothetical protein
MKINNQASLFDLDDYSLDRPTGDYDWENSELDRMYEQPPPKRPPPDDTRSILAICEWMRGQPNGSIVDLPDVRNLLANLQPPTLREHLKSLPPIANENRGQQNRGHPDYLPPILEPPKSLPPILDSDDRENRGQERTHPERSQLLVTVGDRKIINGVPYILTHTKSPKPIFEVNGWLEVKESVNKRNLYLCLRWRDDGRKRSKHLGKVVKAV